jgi:lipid-binding SYLF domain-containing protein
MMSMRMQGSPAMVIGLAASLSTLVGCASTPRSRPEQQALQMQAQGTLQEMVARDPSLRNILDEAYGYVVFPSVGEGAFIVGGGQGVGVVYQQGRPVGYARLTAGSVGLQVGGQTYSELVVFRSQRAFEDLQRGSTWDMRADATATILRAGAAGASNFDDDIGVFVVPEFGAMAAVSIGGQRMSFEPLA